MKQVQFVSDRTALWDEFSVLLVALKKRRVKGDVVQRFLPLYRSICHDLSVCQSRGYSLSLIARLNQYVVDGHRVLYRPQSFYLLALRDLVAFDFPVCLRRNFRLFLFASLLFYVPALVLALLIQWDVDLVFSVLPAESVDHFRDMYNPDADRMRSVRSSGTDFTMFCFYIFNNISIAFKTFAYGLFFGVGSVFILFYNGLVLGGVAGYLVSIDFEQPLFSFVIAHGAFELTAIVISGMAGFKLGLALLMPGRLSRLLALQRAARDAMPLVYGVFFMLVIAAFIEAYWSSMTFVPFSVKYGVGGVLWVLVGLYFWRAGRSYVVRG